ncbi:isoprenyl transferase [Salibacterium salarium]|uniref:Isoprenyl transferase n=1 Tax=Salibacterium salarium TaxID=284579 RepID=A0A3R9P5C9_9BACI|nr:isoprenyl transferase [Salibacterium salarium]RSL33198.1 isoprenyl transferase [Salibacterium salarium]
MINRFFSHTELKTDNGSTRLDQDNIPSHIAIIMDGNGRWAKNKGLPRVAGHREGMKVVTNIVEKANEIGVRYLTLYAFSTENWKRPEKEVEFLMKLPERFLEKELPNLQKNNVKVRTIGDTSLLPRNTVRAVEKAVEETADNTGLVLNFALNYGGRHELVEMVKVLGEDIAEGTVNPEDITENLLSERLLTQGLPDPDLLIRTSGEIRLSNFMLWQLAYSEFWFTEVLWPDFKDEDLVEAVKEYQQRKRRYGGV